MLIDAELSENSDDSVLAVTISRKCKNLGVKNPLKNIKTQKTDTADG